MVSLLRIDYVSSTKWLVGPKVTTKKKAKGEALTVKEHTHILVAHVCALDMSGVSSC